MKIPTTEKYVKKVNNFIHINFPSEKGWECVSLYSIQKIVEILESVEKENITAVIISPLEEKTTQKASYSNYEEGIIHGTKGQNSLKYIETFHAPIISLVYGNVFDTGFELMLSTHFVIAKEDTHFGFPSIIEGKFPQFGGIQKLVRNIGRNKSLELLLATPIIDSKTALNLNLINIITQNPEEKAIELIYTIEKIPASIRKAIIESINAYETNKGYQVELVNFAKSITEN